MIRRSIVQKGMMKLTARIALLILTALLLSVSLAFSSLAEDTLGEIPAAEEVLEEDAGKEAWVEDAATEEDPAEEAADDDAEEDIAPEDLPEETAKAEKNLETHYLLQGMANIVPVEGTRYLMVQSPVNLLWGVYNTDGELLIEEQFDNLTYLGYGCFETGPYPDPLWNWKGLIGPGGSFVTNYSYGIFLVYNEYWAAGLTVDAGTEEAYDYSPGEGEYYRIDRCDIFRLGDDPGRVAQLTGEQFRQAAAHGKYLSVEDRSGKITVYDREFFPVTDFTAESLTDSVYGVFDYALIDRTSGDIILDGVTASKEIQTARGLLFQVTHVNYSGKKLIGICDLNGEWLMEPGSYTVNTVGTDYAVVTQSKLKGLYSYEEKRLVLPCEYSSIVSSASSSDAYVFYGYACGVKDGERNYVNVDTGETAATLKYSSKTMKTLGGTVYKKVVTDLYLITSANGSVWYLQNGQIPSQRGNGRLIVCFSLDSWSYGVMTMDGDIAVPFWYSTQPLITDDGKVVLKSGNNGYSLIEVVW